MKRSMLVAAGMVFLCACASAHPLGPGDLTYVAHVSTTSSSPATFHLTGSVTNDTPAMIRLHLFGACGTVGFRLYAEATNSKTPVFKYDPVCAGPEDLMDRGVILQPGDSYQVDETYGPFTNIPKGNYRLTVAFYESHIPLEAAAGLVVIQ